jgi:hypothetical protein
MPRYRLWDAEISALREVERVREEHRIQLLEGLPFELEMGSLLKNGP